MCIRRLSTTQQYDMLNDYLDEYLPNAEKVIARLYTGKPSVDSFLSEKVATAEYSNIKVTLNVSVLPDFYFNPVQLNIILGNALDNAIEACNKLPDDHSRYISLDLKADENWLNIRVVNSSLPVNVEDGGIPLTDKEDKAHHGFGLNTINQLVRRNNGIMHCKYENGEFIFLVRIRSEPGGSVLL